MSLLLFRLNICSINIINFKNSRRGRGRRGKEKHVDKDDIGIRLSRHIFAQPQPTDAEVRRGRLTEFSPPERSDLGGL